LRIGIEYESHDRYDTTVSRLILVLHDLHGPRPDPGAGVSLPRLPALEQWLARGDIASTPGGWRQWLQHELADHELAALPAASVAGAGVQALPADQPLWLATPVHMVAGLDTVRVHPAGLLRLAEEEQRILQDDFARVFAGSGWSLHATGRRELLLAGSSTLKGAAIRSADPALWLGADPRAGLPSGPGSESLRRFGAELEMWLHEHPVNLARAARGVLTVSALWIWGGGAAVARKGMVAAAAPVPAPAMTAWADELFIDGLAHCVGLRVEPLPQRWPRRGADRAPTNDLLAVCSMGVAPDQRWLQGLESDWIAPALATWHAGELHTITLLAADRVVTLRRSPLRSLLRKFRRVRPWWEALQ
jgi:hypothetical protein